jgi:hypothetical protein
LLRFPNPGSTTDNFIRVYTAAFERLDGRVIDLDDIVETVVAANLATSSGYMGAEAVTRSTRADRSRDPLYNQLKMYAELFRTLGWLHPTRESSLNFTFTLLGEQLVAAGRDYWPLVEECILGIAYPTRVLSVKGDYDLRPFSFILKVMAASGGYLSRDEMIIGPLSASSDRNAGAVTAVAAEIARARRSKAAIDAALEKLATARKTQVNTLHNYTRWPIAVLRDSGWVEVIGAKFGDGRVQQVWSLTDKGRAVAARVGAAFDLRLSDVEKLNAEERKAITVLAHYQMLDRAGFDIEPMAERLKVARNTIKPFMTRSKANGDNLLFSPFQALSIDDMLAAFPAHGAGALIERAAGPVGSLVGRDDRAHLFVAPRLVRATAETATEAQPVRNELARLLKRHGSAQKAAAAFAEAHAKDTQTAFYPLITHLFQILGFRSEFSRAGVNYQRWDACLWIGNHAVPVEIKSPTEELFLSTKAVRQALENKIILLARGGLETRRELTSLIVGYKLPNERGDMSNLIDNVFKAYNLPLGVIDLVSLAYLAARSVVDGVTIDHDQLSRLRGFLDV